VVGNSTNDNAMQPEFNLNAQAFKPMQYAKLENVSAPIFKITHHPDNNVVFKGSKLESTPTKSSKS
jgi:hypothetical protein